MRDYGRAHSLAELGKRGEVVLCDCHALILVPRTDDGRPINPLIELWVEDDENYFLKHSFDAAYAQSVGEAILDVDPFASSASGAPAAVPAAPLETAYEMRGDVLEIPAFLRNQHNLVAEKTARIRELEQQLSNAEDGYRRWHQAFLDAKYADISPSRIDLEKRLGVLEAAVEEISKASRLSDVQSIIIRLRSSLPSAPATGPQT